MAAAEGTAIAAEEGLAGCDRLVLVGVWMGVCVVGEFLSLPLRLMLLVLIVSVLLLL
jgi:hypothetical protein